MSHNLGTCEILMLKSVYTTAQITETSTTRKKHFWEDVKEIVGEVPFWMGGGGKNIFLLTSQESEVPLFVERSGRGVVDFIYIFW